MAEMAQFGTGYGEGYSRRQAVYDDELDSIGPHRLAVVEFSDSHEVILYVERGS